MVPSAPLHAHTSAWAANVIRKRIADGDIAPGARLTETGLAEDLGVSRNTLRESFTILAGEQLVEKLPNRGTFVITPDENFVRELYRVRGFVEPSALMWGELTEDIDGAFAQLRTDIDQASASRDLANLNQHFHTTVVSMTSSETLITTMAQLLARMRLVFQLKGHEPDFHQYYAQQNIELIEMIRAGKKEESAQRCHEYLVTAEADLLSLFTAED